MTVIVNLGVEYFRDFEFGFIINSDWQRWGLNAIRDRIRSRWFQHGNMEYRIYSTETVWKSYHDGMGARSCKDFVWSEEFLCEFLGGLCHMEELSLDICLATDFEFQGRKPSGISGSLVLMLSFSDVLLKLLVQLVEVGDKVTCTCGSKVMFRVNGKVQMVTLVGKEGCNAGSGTRSIVVSKLS